MSGQRPSTELPLALLPHAVAILFLRGLAQQVVAQPVDECPVCSLSSVAGAPAPRPPPTDPLPKDEPLPEAACYREPLVPGRRRVPCPDPPTQQPSPRRVPTFREAWTWFVGCFSTRPADPGPGTS